MRWVSDFDAFTHDLRHYLREVVTQSQLIMKREGDSLSPETRTTLERVIAAGRTGDDLVRAMVEYQEADTKPLQPISLASLLAGVQMDLRDQLGDTTLIVTSDLASATAVPAPARRILAELVFNAVKFGGSEVHLTIRADGDFVLADVRDNGIGIEPRYRENVFEPFRRLHSRAAYPGFGLGLAVSTRLANRMGGSLVVADCEPGRGSTFRLRIPLNAEDERA